MRLVRPTTSTGLSLVGAKLIADGVEPQTENEAAGTYELFNLSASSGPFIVAEPPAQNWVRFDGANDYLTNFSGVFASGWASSSFEFVIRPYSAFAETWHLANLSDGLVEVEPSGIKANTGFASPFWGYAEVAWTPGQSYTVRMDRDVAGGLPGGKTGRLLINGAEVLSNSSALTDAGSIYWFMGHASIPNRRAPVDLRSLKLIRNGVTVLDRTDLDAADWNDSDYVAGSLTDA